MARLMAFVHASACAGNAAQREKIGMMIAIRSDYQDAISREQIRRAQAERQEGGE